jgi:hypothetical protein
MVLIACAVVCSALRVEGFTLKKLRHRSATTSFGPEAFQDVPRVAVACGKKRAYRFCRTHTKSELPPSRLVVRLKATSLAAS